MGAFATGKSNVSLYGQSPKPSGFAPEQTNAAYNYQSAQASAAADPRMNLKGFDRAGVSRGKGQEAYAASQAANAYAQQMSGAETIPLQDAAANANLSLQQQVSQEQLGLQLAQLQEQMRQQQALASLQRQSNAMGFAGGMFKDITGSLGGGGLLSGLLG